MTGFMFLVGHRNNIDHVAAKIAHGKTGLSLHDVLPDRSPKHTSLRQVSNQVINENNEFSLAYVSLIHIVEP